MAPARRVVKPPCQQFQSRCLSRALHRLERSATPHHTAHDAAKCQPLNPVCKPANQVRNVNGIPYQLAARQMMNGQTEAALENLLTIMKKDRQFNDDAARKMIFKIFDSLGDHPLVANYRRKMMSLIY